MVNFEKKKIQENLQNLHSLKIKHNLEINNQEFKQNLLKDLQGEIDQLDHSNQNKQMSEAFNQMFTDAFELFQNKRKIKFIVN